MWAGTDAAGRFKLFQYKAIFGSSDAPGDVVSVVSEVYSSITSLAIAQSYLHAAQCRWGLSATNGVLSASLWTIPPLPATHVLLSFFDTVAADGETQITSQVYPNSASLDPLYSYAVGSAMTLRMSSIC